MSETIESILREAFRQANKKSDKCDWFMYKGVVFSSDSASETAPKTDPSLSQEHIDAVHEEVMRAMGIR